MTANSLQRGWKAMNVEKFKTSLLCHETLVACINHQIVGFADMDKTGYLDHLYVHKDHQRKGIASALCDALEKQSKALGFETHSSITACRFLKKEVTRSLKNRKCYVMIHI